jgi:NADP-dependent 3-hydroxy acid dehydrogenase YdfG
MMRSEDVAEALLHACSMPEHVTVEDLYMQPAGGPL